MEVKNCKSCGKIFNYLSGPPLCPFCMKALDAKFEAVKEYIYDHPKVGINEVSEVMEVSVNQIRQWIREERLAFAEDSMIGLSCEGCGTMIKTGRYCKHCKEQLAKGFDKLYVNENTKKNNKDPKTNPKMRFLDNK